MKYVCGLPLVVKAVDIVSPSLPSWPVSLLALIGLGASTCVIAGIVRRVRRSKKKSPARRRKKRASSAPPGRTEKSQTLGVAVVAPLEIIRDDDIMIQVVGDVEKILQQAIAKAVRLDRAHRAEAHGTCFFPVRNRQRLVFRLSTSGLLLDEAEQDLVWHGRGFKLNFFAHVPREIKLGGVACELLIQAEDAGCGLLPVGRIKFMMNVVCDKCRPKDRAATTARRFTQYFCSFATQDYQAVLDRIQGLSISDPDWDRHFYFYQLAKAGTNWQKEEFDYIDNEADVFLLFWSSNAAASSNVREEWMRALKRLRRDPPLEFKPIVIESPMPKPPEELAHIQFLDKTLVMRGK